MRNKGNPVCDPDELEIVNPILVQVKYPNERESTDGINFRTCPLPQVTPADDQSERGATSDVTAQLCQPGKSLSNCTIYNSQRGTDIQRDEHQQVFSGRLKLIFRL